MKQPLASEAPLLITSDDPESRAKLTIFNNNSQKWLVSVAMVSEGTDIPRLQLCCHLTRICTELHFRQLLGRVLRRRSQDNCDHATMLFPAHPDLLKYVSGIAMDVPESVLSSKQLPHRICETSKQSSSTNSGLFDNSDFEQGDFVDAAINEFALVGSKVTEPQLQTFSAFGRYKQEVLTYVL